MKIITLDQLTYCTGKINNILSSLKSSIKTLEERQVGTNMIENESIVKAKLEQSIQEALDKANQAVQETDFAELIEGQNTRKQEVDNAIAAIENTISQINAIVNGNKDAIEAAKAQNGTTAQALANAVTNIENAQTELIAVKNELGLIDSDIDVLKINRETAADDIAKLKEKAEQTSANVANINASLTTVQDAIGEQANDISQIKIDLGAIDGLAEVQQKIQDIEELVEEMETQNLTSYVKKTELPDAIVTKIAELEIIDEDTKKVKFYTKEEAAGLVSTTIANYDSNLKDTTLKQYYTKDETAEKVRTVLFNAGLVDSENKTNVYTKNETASLVDSSVASYTDNKLTNYSTIGQTSEAITNAVGDLNMNQYSTKTQTASAIEEAIGEFDENNLKKNYYDKTATATYVSTQMNSYVDDKLQNYSTVVQTAEAIQTAIGEIEETDLSNYYTKTETATYVSSELYTTLDEKLIDYSTIEQTSSAINTAIADINDEFSNYYTKTETAQLVETNLSDYDTVDGVNAKLTKYSTLTQTAAEIKAELFEAGLTTEEGTLTRAVVTADEVSTQIIAKTADMATTSYVDQKADSITSVVMKTVESIAPASVRNAAIGVTIGEAPVFSESNNWWTAEYNVSEGDVYTVRIQSNPQATSSRSFIVFLDADGNCVNRYKGDNEKLVAEAGIDAYTMLEDYVTIPANVKKMLVMGYPNKNVTQQPYWGCINVSDATRIGSYSAITQLSDSIGLCAKTTDITGEKLISSINLGQGTVAIDGKYIHITGDTVFDDDVTIKGDMTAGRVAIADSDVVLDKNGLRFIDSNNKSYGYSGRMIIGKASDGKTVTFNTAWDSIPTVLVMPMDFQTTFTGYSTSNLKVTCKATNITRNGFKVNCYTTLANGSSGATNSQTLGSVEKHYAGTGTKTETICSNLPIDNIPATATSATLNFSADITAPHYTVTGDDSSVTYFNVGNGYITFDIYANGVKKTSVTTATIKGTSPTNATATANITFTAGQAITVTATATFYVKTGDSNASATANVSTDYAVVNEQKIGSGTATFIAIENLNAGYTVS